MTNNDDLGTYMYSNTRDNGPRLGLEALLEGYLAGVYPPSTQ